MPPKPSEIKIKDIMTTKIVAAQKDDRVLDVARVMMTRDFSGVPIVGPGNKLVGMISMKELLNSEGLYLPTIVELANELEVFHPKDRPVAAKKIQNLKNLRVQTIMDAKPFYLREEINLEQAAEAFLVHRAEVLPVTDRSGILVGIVSRYDMLQALTQPLERMKLHTEITGEIEPVNVLRDINKEFVLVSRGRARFWYLGILSFFILGFIVSLLWILRIKIK